MTPIFFVVEATAVLALVPTPIVLNIKPALALGAGADLLQYRLRLISFGLQRTAGAAAATWAPRVCEDITGTDPLLRLQSLAAVAPNTFVNQPLSDVYFTLGTGGAFSIVPAPNVAGDPGRNRIKTLDSGYTRVTTKEIKLPSNWDSLPKT